MSILKKNERFKKMRSVQNLRDDMTRELKNARESKDEDEEDNFPESNKQNLRSHKKSIKRQEENNNDENDY